MGREWQGMTSSHTCFVLFSGLDQESFRGAEELISQILIHSMQKLVFTSRYTVNARSSYIIWASVSPPRRRGAEVCVDQLHIPTAHFANQMVASTSERVPCRPDADKPITMVPVRPLAVGDIRLLRNVKRICLQRVSAPE